MGTVRIYRVAELLGTTSQEVTALLKRDHGIDVKSASSTIEEVVARWTGVPVTSIKEEEIAKLLRIEEELHKRVISQEKAISALARAIRRSRAGLKASNRPAGSFLFLGPTGVGKTEVARALAGFLFGSENDGVPPSLLAASDELVRLRRERGLDEAALDRKGVIGDWSIKNVLAHIAAWEAWVVEALPTRMTTGATPEDFRRRAADASLQPGHAASG